MAGDTAKHGAGYRRAASWPTKDETQVSKRPNVGGEEATTGSDVNPGTAPAAHRTCTAPPRRGGAREGADRESYGGRMQI